MVRYPAREIELTWYSAGFDRAISIEHWHGRWRTIFVFKRKGTGRIVDVRVAY